MQLFNYKKLLDKILTDIGTACTHTKIHVASRLAKMIFPNMLLLLCLS